MAIRDAQSAIEVFRQPVILTRIKITCPTSNVRVENQADEFAAILRAAGGKYKATLPTYALLDPSASGKGKKFRVSLEGARNALNNGKKYWLEPYLLPASDGSRWYLPAAQAEAFLDTLEAQLGEIRDEQIAQLLEDYDEALEDYKQRLNQVLKEASMLEQYAAFLARFPTRTEIQENLGFEVAEWEELPTLEALQKETIGDRVAAQKRKVVERTLKRLREDVPAAEQEALELFGAFLLKVQDKDIEGYHARRTRKYKGDQSPEGELETDIRLINGRVPSLIDLWEAATGDAAETLRGMLIQVQAIASLVNDPSCTSERKNRALAELRRQWRGVATTSGAGRKKLDEFLDPETSILGRIGRLKEKLDALKTIPEADRDIEDTAAIERLESEVEIQHGILKLKLDALGVGNEALKTGDDILPPPPTVTLSDRPVTEHHATGDELAALPIRTLKRLAQGRVNGYSNMRREPLAQALTGLVLKSEIEGLTPQASSTPF